MRFLDYAILSAGVFSTFVPALFAQSGAHDNAQGKAPGIFEKAPYSLINIEVGGGLFSPQSSSANAPTQNCPGGIISTNLRYDCAEQFSRAGSGGFEMGVRPIRYLEAGVRTDILGNFNGYQSNSATYQCVSGCTGVVNENIVTSSALITLNAQGVLPLFREHLLISAGGGIGWLEVRSNAQTGSAQVQGGCPSCPPPQGGHGPTAVAGMMYFPNRHVGFGLQFRDVQISSPGLSQVAGPFYGPITYKDRFYLISGEISVRFGKRD
ncbi:MAG TPA: hypothetical protein VGG72_35300 [Bryobacteraceae bacterium]|jgi:hypothetical protein